MDIISHAVAGAATGLAFGDPVLGALVAMFPDIPLLFRERLKKPPEFYVFTHSLFFLFGVSGLLIWYDGHLGYLVFFCTLSHLVLDIPTHSSTWAPKLLMPFSNVHFSHFKEWELFNASWYNGLILTIIWCIIWLIVAQYSSGIGFL